MGNSIFIGGISIFIGGISICIGGISNFIGGISIFIGGKIITQSGPALRFLEPRSKINILKIWSPALKLQVVCFRAPL